MGKLFSPAERKQIERDMWSHLKNAVAAIEAGDRQAMIYEQAALTGMLDLNVKGEPRHEQLCKKMIQNLGAELRKKVGK
jgi:hypothetical protein